MKEMKKFKRILSIIFLSAIPAFLSYLSSSNLIFKKLIEKGLMGDSVDIEKVQDYCLLIGILFSAIALSMNLYITKQKRDDFFEQRNSLIKMSKVLLSESLGQRFLSQPSSFDIRIFIPKHPLLYWFADKVKNGFLHRKFHHKFVIKNIDLMAERGITKGLQFEVEPIQEGLVGLCYKEKKMYFDDDLEHTNSEKYKLNQNQIDRTSNLKWSICSPIIDNNNKVVAIIALDGTTRLEIDEEKAADLREHLLAFSIMLYDSVPKLFKR